MTTVPTFVSSKESLFNLSGAHNAIAFIPSKTNYHAGNLADLAHKVGEQDPTILSPTVDVGPVSKAKVSTNFVKADTSVNQQFAYQA